VRSCSENVILFPVQLYSLLHAILFFNKAFIQTPFEGKSKNVNILQSFVAIPW